MKNILSRAAMSRMKARRWLFNALSVRSDERLGHGEAYDGVQRIWLLYESASATLDYLVLPALEHLGKEIVPITLEVIPRQDELTPGTLVVVVRYINARWATFLDRHYDRLSGLIYFMDDDLFDKAARVGLPAPFVKKLERLVDPFRKWLTIHSSAIWVSSAALEVKYAALGVKCVEWKPASKSLNQSEPIWVFYHGSGSHQAEQRWLRDVIENVINDNELIHFEIIGDLAVNRLFRSLPRTSILHPMTWPNYLAYSAAARRQIGLAPLLPGLYNAARGPTKYFDFARLGAVGLYTDVEPYRHFIRDGEDGLLLPNHVPVWVDAILRLAKNADLRNHMTQEARARALGMSTSVCASSNDGAGRG